MARGRATQAAAARRYYERNREQVIAAVRDRDDAAKEANPVAFNAAVNQRVRRHRRKRREEGEERYLEEGALRMSRRRAEAIDHVNAIKESTPCADCAVSYPAVVMDFDHVCGEKEAPVSRLVNTGQSIARIDAEIAKCEVVCSNCHRLRTWERKSRHLTDYEAAVDWGA